jgi:hypothetical protein
VITVLMRVLLLPCLAFVLVVGGCFGKEAHDGLFLLRWIETPRNRGLFKDTPAEDLCELVPLETFNHTTDQAKYAALRESLLEGDVIAYWMTSGEVGRALLKGQWNKAVYGAVKYGHLGILIKDPKNPERLVMFSSEGFKGANQDDDLENLDEHSFEVFRLDKIARLDTARLQEFSRLAIDKGGNFFGYDFSGMLGLWNGNLKPSRPEDISREYICSTTVVAALYYSGVELEACTRRGFFDSVTPLQVVESKGRFIDLPEMHVQLVEIESSSCAFRK